MTQHQPPGEHIEESSPRPPPIEGVAIGTTAILGVADRGPFGVHGERFASLRDVERTYAAPPLAPTGDAAFRGGVLWYAAKGFFDNGGKRLHIVRLRTAAEGHDEVDESAIVDALTQLETVDEVALLCAPGVRLAQGHERLCELLLQHCDARRDRMALIDAPRGASLAEARALRDRLQSRFGALYYPWVVVRPTAADTESAASEPALVPASAHIAGLFADHDDEPGTHKSPASMPIVSAIALERAIDDDVYDLLGPIGINLLRVLPGRPGVWLWGGRTLSDDDWNFVAVRRYLIYLERSIGRGLRWAVFEPSGEASWDRVVAAIAEFLHGEWRSGALIGSKPEEAYSVRCDRSTMTPTDIAAGRIVAMLGLALLEPAEFVLLRIELAAGAQ